MHENEKRIKLKNVKVAEFILDGQTISLYDDIRQEAYIYFKEYTEDEVKSYIAKFVEATHIERLFNVRGYIFHDELKNALRPSQRKEISYWLSYCYNKEIEFACYPDKYDGVIYYDVNYRNQYGHKLNRYKLEHTYAEHYFK